MNALTRALSIVAVALATALLSGCAWDANAAPGSTSLAGDTVVIEGAWDGDLPVIETFVDGHGPFRFLLDTGAETTIVSPACAEAAGLRTEATALNISSAGAARDRATRTAVLDELRPMECGQKYESLIEMVEDRPGHDLRYAIDPSKLRSDLGFPKETLPIDG